MRIRMLEGEQAIEVSTIDRPGCNFSAECHPQSDTAASPPYPASV
jgi:hypothetical protein